MTSDDIQGGDRATPQVAVSQIHQISIASIRVDGGTQMRVRLDEETVNDYRRQMLDGDTFPPLVVFVDEDGVYWLGNGFHRHAAATACGLLTHACEVRQGTQRDAQFYAASANRKNSLSRTKADKGKAVMALLVDGEWSKLADRAIARHVNVSPTLVGGLRKSLSEKLGRVADVIAGAVHVDTQAAAAESEAVHAADQRDAAGAGVSADGVDAAPATAAPQAPQSDRTVGEVAAAVVPAGESVPAVARAEDAQAQKAQVVGEASPVPAPVAGSLDAMVAGLGASGDVIDRTYDRTDLIVWARAFARLVVPRIGNRLGEYVATAIFELIPPGPVAAADRSGAAVTEDAAEGHGCPASRAVSPGKSRRRGLKPDAGRVAAGRSTSKPAPAGNGDGHGMD